MLRVLVASLTIAVGGALDAAIARDDPSASWAATSVPAAALTATLNAWWRG
jgi:hypothetical protein